MITAPTNYIINNKNIIFNNTNNNNNKGLRVGKKNSHTVETSYNYAIYVHHWGGGDLELEQLISHFHRSKSSLDYHGLIPCNFQNIRLSEDGRSFS